MALKSYAEPLNKGTRARSELIHSMAHWGLCRDYNNERSRLTIRTDIHSG